MSNHYEIKKLPISAFIASCNEGHLLEDCLKSISFCDEIVGVNLESTDNTKEIMQKYCHQYIEHKRVPIIEDIHPDFLPNLKNEWFIVIDPDERILPELVKDIEKSIQTADSKIAMIRVPMFNHFKGKKLNYTVYGGLISFRLLFRKEGISLNNDIHKGIVMKEGYDRQKIHYTGENYDKHLWCSGWSQLYEKHNRYVKKEGAAQYNSGNRYKLSLQLKNTLIQFYYSYKARQGYKDGFRGFLLSVFAARYEFLKWSSLKKYQKSFQ
jgi:glycosyltransferase involved in cell wall biosynthesis